MSAIPSPDGVFISERTNICSLSEDFSRGGDGNLEADIGAIILEQGFSFSEHTNIRFRVRGALSCGAGKTVAQLGMSLLEAVAQLWMSL